MSGALTSEAGITDGDSGIDMDDADQCSMLVLDTLPWKRIRISLVGLYSRSQPFRYKIVIEFSSKSYLCLTV